MRDPGEVAFRCISIDCPAQALERLLHWASRGALDIDGMGEEIVSRLVESGRVADVADYYSLSEEELASLDMGRVKADGEPVRLGHTVAKKLVAAIEASKGRTFARVLFGLGIRHVGKTTAEAIAAAYPSMDALSAAGEDELAGIYGAVSYTHLDVYKRQGRACAPGRSRRSRSRRRLAFRRRPRCRPTRRRPAGSPDRR